MQGTNQAEPSLSATDTVEDTDFAAIQRAMLDGNQAELDRLMAVEPAKEPVKEPEVPEVPETPEITSNPEEPSNEDEPGKEPENPEAAPSAASTATNADELETLKRELHQYKSDAGRMPFIQRRMAELERELRAYKAREVAPTQGNPSKVDTSKVEIDPEVQKQIDELKEIDPVLAKTMETIAKTAIGAANQARSSAVEEVTKQEQEAEDYRFYTEQKSILLQQVPQADAIFQTPQWQQWKQGLSPGRRAMAESGYADDVVTALHAFAADMQRQYGTAQPAPAAQPTQPVATTPEKTEVTEARERKVATAATVHNPSAKKPEVFDEQAAFREIYKQVAKEQNIL